jgi:hypothetical protein
LDFAEQDMPEQEVAFGGFGLDGKKSANGAFRLVYVSLP